MRWGTIPLLALHKMAETFNQMVSIIWALVKNSVATLLILFETLPLLFYWLSFYRAGLTEVSNTTGLVSLIVFRALAIVLQGSNK